MLVWPGVSIASVMVVNWVSLVLMAVSPPPPLSSLQRLLRSHWNLCGGHLAFKQGACSHSGTAFFMSETERACSRLCHPLFSRQKIPKNPHSRSSYFADSAQSQPRCLSTSTAVCQTSSTATRCPVWSPRLPLTSICVFKGLVRVCVGSDVVVFLQVEGKGNGIKTVVVNMVDVAKALNRPPTCKNTLGTRLEQSPLSWCISYSKCHLCSMVQGQNGCLAVMLT